MTGRVRPARFALATALGAAAAFVGGLVLGTVWHEIYQARLP